MTPAVPLKADLNKSSVSSFSRVLRGSVGSVLSVLSIRVCWSHQSTCQQWREKRKPGLISILWRLAHWEWTALTDNVKPTLTHWGSPYSLQLIFNHIHSIHNSHYKFLRDHNDKFCTWISRLLETYDKGGNVDQKLAIENLVHNDMAFNKFSTSWNFLSISFSCYDSITKLGTNFEICLSEVAE